MYWTYTLQYIPSFFYKTGFTLLLCSEVTIHFHVFIFLYCLLWVFYLDLIGPDLLLMLMFQIYSSCYCSRFTINSDVLSWLLYSRFTSDRAVGAPPPASCTVMEVIRGHDTDPVEGHFTEGPRTGCEECGASFCPICRHSDPTKGKLTGRADNVVLMYLKNGVLQKCDVQDVIKACILICKKLNL